MSNRKLPNSGSNIYKDAMKIEVHSLTAEDIKKFSENLWVPNMSEETQGVYDTLFNYFSQMIVRCKDCKYRGKGLPYCAYFSETDFCSKGERKEVE